MGPIHVPLSLVGAVGRATDRCEHVDAFLGVHARVLARERAGCNNLRLSALPMSQSRIDHFPLSLAMLF